MVESRRRPDAGSGGARRPRDARPLRLAGDPARMNDRAHGWDEEADVVVVGYGFAGGAAAIAAADAGSRVLLLEKMAVPGGISICSGGGLRVANDAAKAMQYLEATNAGTVPVELLRAFAHEMTTVRPYLESL